MAQHAILGPSSASKWLNCTPSARLELRFDRKQSDAADEGTLAHSLGELIIAFRTNRITNKLFREQLKLIGQSEYYNTAMYEYCDNYAVYVIEQWSEAKAVTPDAQLHLETTLPFDRWVPEGFGTIDVTVVSEPVLSIIDLKYGKGVEVSAVDNPQLKIYALAVLDEYDGLYNFKTVRMTIYQPRMNNISVWEISVNDLLRWGHIVLMSQAALAFDGIGDFVPGKHCLFCKAKINCKANADYQLNVAQTDFAELEQLDGSPVPFETDFAVLSDEQILAIYARVDEFKSWLTAIDKYVLDEAKMGRKWAGYKLVNGKSPGRKITDVEAVEKLLLKEKFDRAKMFKPQELVGITALEALTGKKWFDANISPFTIKTPGAPTLVGLDDKRAEYKDGATVAAEDFKELQDN